MNSVEVIPFYQVHHHIVGVVLGTFQGRIHPPVVLHL